MRRAPPPRAFSPILAAIALGLVAAFAAAAGAQSRTPTLARSVLRGGENGGVVFFLRTARPEGAVAVGAAHSFDRTRLAESVEVEFTPPGAVEPAARSTRYLTRPGRSYRAPGSSMRQDHVVFALTEAPRGVRILEAADELPAVGATVEIVGLGVRARAEERVLGTLVRVDTRRLEIELPEFRDLKGWGGAPVLDVASGRVVGLLQAAWPAEGRFRTGAGPIGGVQEALEAPLDDGLGRLFATMAPLASAANSPAARRRAATGSPFGDGSKVSARSITEALRRTPARPPPAPSVLDLQIEYPPQDSTVGDAGSVFLAGHALSRRSAATRFDLVIVVDTSSSTLQPTGVDVDGDGTIGTARGDSDRALAGQSTDPGDSILAAEISAAVRVIEGLDPRRTRVGIVTFSGLAEARDPFGRLPVRVVRAAKTLEPLTSDYDRILQAFADLRDRDAFGSTHIAAGIDQATLELLGIEGALSAADPLSQKIVLFFTDGQPTLPQPGADGVNLRAVLDAASRARRAGVRIHSFAIGPEALEGPASTVEMAAATDGVFTPVPDPGALTRFVETTNFAKVAAIEVRNGTGDWSAHLVRVHADGSFDALVPLTPGANAIEVRATDTDGRSLTRTLRVIHRPGGQALPVPAELVAKRGEQLRRRVDQLEMLRLEAIRKELVIEIDRERAAAEARAARQLKLLDIEADPDPE